MGAETVERSRDIGRRPGMQDSTFWNDVMFTQDFAETRVLDGHDWSGADGRLAVSDVDRLLDPDDGALVSVPTDVLAAVVRDGSALFENWDIRRDRPPRYLWYATRMGKSTGPAGVSTVRWPRSRSSGRHTPHTLRE